MKKLVLRIVDTGVFLFDIHSHLYWRILLPPHPPPPSQQKWFETGLYCNHCIQKPQVWELSRLWPETSIKFYVHEFGFWMVVARPLRYLHNWALSSGKYMKGKILLPVIRQVKKTQRSRRLGQVWSYRRMKGGNQKLGFPSRFKSWSTIILTVQYSMKPCVK